MEWFDCHAVAEGLVYHASVVEQGPEVGNQRVVEETEGEPRLHATWAMLPAQTGELGTMEQFLAGMREHGVRALRAYPEQHRYLLNGVTFGPDWKGITSLLAEFPELTLIVVRHGSWGDDRYFRPLLERYRNLHVDTSNYQIDHGIEDVVRKYGPERLLYGSGSPELQMGAALLTTAQADIDDDAKAAIAGGNLRRLLAEVKL